MNGSQNYKLSMEMNYNITVLISVLLTIIGTKCMYMNINLFMFIQYIRWIIGGDVVLRYSHVVLHFISFLNN